MLYPQHSPFANNDGKGEGKGSSNGKDGGGKGGFHKHNNNNNNYKHGGGKGSGSGNPGFTPKKVYVTQADGDGALDPDGNPFGEDDHGTPAADGDDAGDDMDDADGNDAAEVNVTESSHDGHVDV